MDHVFRLFGRDSKRQTGIPGYKLNIILFESNRSDSRGTALEAAYVPSNELNHLSQSLATKMGLDIDPGSTVQLWWIRLRSHSKEYRCQDIFTITSHLPGDVIFGKHDRFGLFRGYPSPFRGATKYEFDQSFHIPQQPHVPHSQVSRKYSWFTPRSWSWASSNRSRDNTKHSPLHARDSSRQLAAAKATLRPALAQTSTSLSGHGVEKRPDNTKKPEGAEVGMTEGLELQLSNVPKETRTPPPNTSGPIFKSSGDRTDGPAVQFSECLETPEHPAAETDNPTIISSASRRKNYLLGFTGPAEAPGRSIHDTCNSLHISSTETEARSLQAIDLPLPQLNHGFKKVVSQEDCGQKADFASKIAPVASDTFKNGANKSNIASLEEENCRKMANVLREISANSASGPGASDPSPIVYGPPSAFNSRDKIAGPNPAFAGEPCVESSRIVPKPLLGSAPGQMYVEPATMDIVTGRTISSKMGELPGKIELSEHEVEQRAVSEYITSSPEVTGHLESYLAKGTEVPRSRGTTVSYKRKKFLKKDRENSQTHDNNTNLRDGSNHSSTREPARSRRPRSNRKVPRIRRVKPKKLSTASDVDLDSALHADGYWTLDQTINQWFHIDSDTGSTYWYEDSESEDSLESEDSGKSQLPSVAIPREDY